MPRSVTSASATCSPRNDLTGNLHKAATVPTDSPIDPPVAPLAASIVRLLTPRGHSQFDEHDRPSRLENTSKCAWTTGPNSCRRRRDEQLNIESFGSPTAPQHRAQSAH